MFLNRKKLNGPTNIQKNQKIAIGFNLTLASIFFVYSFYNSFIESSLSSPIPKENLQRTRINYLIREVSSDPSKWKKGRYHSPIPYKELIRTIDSLISRNSNFDLYRNKPRDSFEIVCFDIAYDDNTANLFTENLDWKKRKKLFNHFELSSSASLVDSNRVLRLRLKNELNKAYAITFRGDILPENGGLIKINNVDYLVISDFGNLCPPECDAYIKDILLEIQTNRISIQTKKRLKDKFE